MRQVSEPCETTWVVHIIDVRGVELVAPGTWPEAFFIGEMGQNIALALSG